MLAEMDENPQLMQQEVGTAVGEIMTEWEEWQQGRRLDQETIVDEEMNEDEFGEGEAEEDDPGVAMVRKAWGR